MAHRVTLMPSGHSFEVPAGKAILTAGLDAGCNMPYSCRSGCCLTCQGRLLEGEVDYGFVLDIYLTPERKASGTVLLCQAKPLSDVVVEVHELSLQGIKPGVFPSKVRRIEQPAPDVAVVTLRMPPFDSMLFAAGQYIDLLLENGQRRSYSVANAPAVGLIDLELHVRHTPGGLFSDRVFKTLVVDERLQFEGPLGTFYLREESDKPIVFVASGTGFGPIKSIIEYALKRKMARPMTLYWGCRTRADLYMMDKPQAWAAANPGFTFIPVLSDEKWEGRTGFVHSAVMEDFPDLSGHQVYACGAPVMVEAARSDFAAKCGLPADEFFADAFLTEADKLEEHNMKQFSNPAFEPKRLDSVVKPSMLSHGTLECIDMKVSRRFYEEFLGLEVVRMGRPALALRCGMKFHIVAVQIGNQAKRASVLQHWGIEVDTREEVDAAHKKAHELKEKYGIRQVLDPVLQHGVYSFYFEDLDYNWWEIQHYDGFQHDDFFDFGDRIPMEMDATVENMRELSIKSSQ